MSFQDYADSFKTRLKIGEMNSKIVIGILFIAGIAVAASLILAFSSVDAYSDNEDKGVEFENSDSVSEQCETSTDGNTSIYVHVTGSVNNPGVYELLEGSRANNAIEAAGGFSKTADIEALNLAEVVIDGQQIVVPKKTKKGTAQTSASNSNPNIKENNSTNQTSSASQNVNSTSSGLVNINTADSSELQTLSGIGEAKAKKIIDYREQNGSFKSVDELTNVSGIGEKTLESIRSSICV